MKAKTELKIIVECNACCPDTMEIVKVDYGDERDYYINFRIDSFYAGQSVIGIIKARLRLAWLAIRKGNYIHQEIITTREALMELRDGLIQMNLEITQNKEKVEVRSFKEKVQKVFPTAIHGVYAKMYTDHHFIYLKGTDPVTDSIGSGRSEEEAWKVAYRLHGLLSEANIRIGPVKGKGMTLKEAIESGKDFTKHDVQVALYVYRDYIYERAENGRLFVPTASDIKSDYWERAEI